MPWSIEQEKDWQLLFADLAEASHGFFLIEYDRSLTREAILRRMQAEFDRRGWSLAKLPLAGGRFGARMENIVKESPAKATLVRLDRATPPQLQALNLARERLYALPTVLLFLTSKEAHTALLTSARDLVTWIAPPFQFALPEMDVPNLPPPVEQVSPDTATQIEYYREQVLLAMEADDRPKAFNHLPALADLYLGATMYEAAYQLYQTLERYHEALADERQVKLFARRADTAQGWRILTELESGRLAANDRIFLERVLNTGLFSVQKSTGGDIIVDEMGYNRPLPARLLVTLQVLSEDVTLGKWDTLKLFQILSKHFDKEELRVLCFGLDIDYDSLPGEGIDAKSRELIRYLERRNRLAKLVERGRQMRPDVSWNEARKSSGLEPAMSRPSPAFPDDIELISERLRDLEMTKRKIQEELAQLEHRRKELQKRQW